jgi:hypothetical protein
MTPEAQNHYLGLAHLIYGVSNVVLITLAVVFFLSRIHFWNREDMILSSLGIGLVVVGNAVYTLPSYVAAWALLKRRPWAKTAAIVAAVPAIMYFPLGTAVAAYTFWVLFGRPGWKLHEKRV